MGLHLHNLLTTWRDWMNPGQRELTLGMLSQLRQCGCPVISLDQQIHSEQAEALNEVCVDVLVSAVGLIW